MKRKTNADALRLQLMQAMERINTDNDGPDALSDAQMSIEIEKCKTIGVLAKVMVDLAKVEVMPESLLLREREAGLERESFGKPLISGVGFFALSE